MVTSIPRFRRPHRKSFRISSCAFADHGFGKEGNAGLEGGFRVDKPGPRRKERGLPRTRQG